MFTPSTKRFDKCVVKDVIVFPNYDRSFKKVTVKCPTTEDGAAAPIGQNSNITSNSESRTTANAVRQLAVICGQTICGNCIYADARNQVDVASIRQHQAIEEETVAEMQLTTLRSQLASRQIAIEASAVEDQLRGLL